MDDKCRCCPKYLKAVKHRLKRIDHLIKDYNYGTARHLLLDAITVINLKIKEEKEKEGEQ